MRAIRGAMTAGCLAVLGLVGGCGGGSTSPAVSPSVPTGSMTYYPSTSTAAPSMSAPAAGASPSGTSGGTTTSSLAMPVLPAEAKKHTPDGAAAFARYYVELINYAWQKPDPSPLLSNASDDCESCKSFAKAAADMKSSGSRVDRPPMKIAFSGPGAQMPKGGQRAIVTGSQQGFRTISRSGEVGSPHPPSEVRMQVFLETTPAGWRVFGIEQVK